MSKMTAESKLLVESGRCVALEFASPRHVMVTMTETGVNSLTLFLRSQDDIDTIQRALATASVQLNHATPIREAAQGTAAANVVPASPSSSGAEPSTDATVGTGTAGEVELGRVVTDAEGRFRLPLAAAPTGTDARS